MITVAILLATLGSSCVVVQINLVCHRNNFAISIMATRWAHVVRALQLAAVGAFVRVVCDQCIVGAAVATAGRCNFVLLDSHGLNFRVRGVRSPHVFRVVIDVCEGHNVLCALRPESNLDEARNIRRFFHFASAAWGSGVRMVEFG